MKPVTHLTVLAVLLLSLVSVSAASAGEALEPLRGAWAAESFEGEPPPANVKMTMTFVDDATLVFDIVVEGQEPQKTEVRYSATAEGQLTIYPEPEENPAGETGKWEVKADKKLYLTSKDDEVLVFTRPAE